jgi:hypothetical protein
VNSALAPGSVARQGSAAPRVHRMPQNVAHKSLFMKTLTRTRFVISGSRQKVKGKVADK